MAAVIFLAVAPLTYAQPSLILFDPASLSLRAVASTLAGPSSKKEKGSHFHGRGVGPRDSFFAAPQASPGLDTTFMDGRRNAWESRPSDWIQSKESLSEGHGEWRPIGPAPQYANATMGNVSGRVEAIAVSPADSHLVLIGGSAGGIWRSTDGGLTFHPVADDQVDIAVGGLAFSHSDPSVVYAGMGNQYERFLGKVLKSTDAGNTWHSTANDTLPLGQTAGIAVDPTDPQHVYLAQASFPNGFSVSRDGGVNWLHTLSGSTNALFLHPTRPLELYVSLRYPADSDHREGLYKSVDGGTTWSLILPSPYPLNMLILIQPTVSAADPDRLYAIVNGSLNGSLDVRTLMSTDDGNTWTDNGAGGLGCCYWFPSLLAVADPVTSTTLYVGESELYKSTNGGVSFTSLTHGYSPGPYPVHVDMHSFAFSPVDHNTFYVGSDGGLWTSKDGGGTFHDLNDTLSLTLFKGLATDPTNADFVFGGTQDNGFLRRRDGTLVWDGLPCCGDAGQGIVNPLSPSTVFNTGARADIYRWHNDGASLDRVCGPGYPSAEAEPDGRMSSYPPFVGNGVDATLYLGTWRLWVSTDLCTTWSKPAGDLDLTTGKGDVLTAIGVARSNSTVLYTGSDLGRVMVSSDRGSTWRDVSAGIPNRSISSITVDPHDPATAFLTVTGYGTGHVFKTTNTGASWNDISGNLPDIPTNALLIDPLDSSIIYAGTDIGVFASPSRGETWYTFNKGMPSAVVTGFAAQAGGLIRLSTYGRGMYELVGRPSCLSPRPCFQPITPPPVVPMPGR